MMKYANAILYVRKQFQCSYFSAASLQKALHCHPNVLFKSTNTHFFFLLPLPFSYIKVSIVSQSIQQTTKNRT